MSIGAVVCIPPLFCITHQHVLHMEAVGYVSRDLVVCFRMCVFGGIMADAGCRHMSTVYLDAQGEVVMPNCVGGTH